MFWSLRAQFGLVDWVGSRRVGSDLDFEKLPGLGRRFAEGSGVVSTEVGGGGGGIRFRAEGVQGFYTPLRTLITTNVFNILLVSISTKIKK